MVTKKEMCIDLLVCVVTITIMSLIHPILGVLATLWILKNAVVAGVKAFGRPRVPMLPQELEDIINNFKHIN